MTHEDTSTALSVRALTTETLNLAVGVDLVVLQDGHLDLLALVLDLLGGAVLLFLALLSTTTQTEDKVESGLLLEVIVAEGATDFQLLAHEDEALLIGRDALLVLDLRLNVVDRIGRFDLERDCLARQGLDEALRTSTETEH